MNLVSTSVPLVSSSHLNSTSVPAPAGMRNEGPDVHMLEMRGPDGVKPYISVPYPQAQAGEHIREFKPNVGEMDVDSVLMGIGTKTELH